MELVGVKIGASCLLMPGLPREKIGKVESTDDTVTVVSPPRMTRYCAKCANEVSCPIYSLLLSHLLPTCLTIILSCKYTPWPYNLVTASGPHPIMALQHLDIITGGDIRIFSKCLFSLGSSFQWEN